MAFSTLMLLMPCVAARAMAGGELCRVLRAVWGSKLPIQRGSSRSSRVRLPALRQHVCVVFQAVGFSGFRHCSCSLGVVARAVPGHEAYTAWRAPLRIKQQRHSPS